MPRVSSLSNDVAQTRGRLLERWLGASLLVARNLARDRVEDLLHGEVLLLDAEPQALLLDALPAVSGLESSSQHAVLLSRQRSETGEWTHIMGISPLMTPQPAPEASSLIPSPRPWYSMSSRVPLGSLLLHGKGKVSRMDGAERRKDKGGRTARLR